MTGDESRGLKIGQRVGWDDANDDLGTVAATDWSGVEIRWDNGKRNFNHHNDMERIRVAPFKAIYGC